MIFGFGKGRQKAKQEEQDEEREEISVLFQGAYNGVTADLKANGRLVQAGLVAAKKLISDALSNNADMIRIDPKGQVAAVLVTVDTMPSPPIRLPHLQAQAVIQIIKLLAGLDIKQKTQPCHGSIKAEFDKREYELRVSTFPVQGGVERMVMRILDPSNKLEKPRDLGFSESAIERIRELASNKNGVILASGPPYSGVTTLKIALMRCSDAYMYSIYVIADFGREISYVKMFEKLPDDDLTKTMMRARREDADIIVLDPIDKPEDAKAAFEFSKDCTIVADMQAKDAAEAILRLIKSTGDANLIASQLRISASQMFIRKLCPSCRRAYRPNPALLNRIGLPPETRVLYRAYLHGAEKSADEIDSTASEGYCRDCKGTGYRGKTGLLEIIEMTPGMQEVVKTAVDVKSIRAQARTEKMQTFQTNGLRLVVEGVTSLEELQRSFKAQA